MSSRPAQYGICPKCHAFTQVFQYQDGEPCIECIPPKHRLDMLRQTPLTPHPTVTTVEVATSVLVDFECPDCYGHEVYAETGDLLKCYTCGYSQLVPR